MLRINVKVIYCYANAMKKWIYEDYCIGILYLLVLLLSVMVKSDGRYSGFIEDENFHTCGPVCVHCSALKSKNTK